MIHGTLALSERICAEAGITRNPPIEVRFQEAIVVPDGTVLTRLKGAVRFSRVGFDLFLKHLHLHLGCLQPLTACGASPDTLAQELGGMHRSHS
jgi:hypothetical protein